MSTIMKKIKKIAVMTSGGDAPGMNAAIRSVVRTCAYYRTECMGIYRGFQGLIEEDLVPLSARSVNNIIHKGGTILKSARSKDFRTKEGRAKAYESLKKHNVDALVIIGGDGSFTGGVFFNKEFNFPIIGIPGTIDNDIFGTSHTLGYDTALNTVIGAVDKIRDTAEAFERIFIVELMGKHSGHIAFNVGIACAAEQVISFENFPTAGNAENNQASKLHALVKEIKQAQANRHASYIIVLAENVWQGGASALAQQLQTLANIDCTACILGHIQRGGSPVAKDRILATKMGVAAIQALLEQHSNIMIAECNNTITHVPLALSVQHQQGVDDNLVAAQDSILALTLP